MTTEPGSGMPTPNQPESVQPPAGPAPSQPGPAPSSTGGPRLPPSSTAPPPQPAPAPPAESTADLLRTMLSRAAEDQLDEQRELAGAMNDVRSQLMRLGQELADMRAHAAPDVSADAQINNVTVEMREAVRFLSERLDGVTRMVAQRGEELADIRGALTGIDAHLRSQAETIGILTAGLQSLPSFGERVSVLQDNLGVVRRQLIGIEETLADEESPVNERLVSIETSVAQLVGRIDAVAESGRGQVTSTSELQAGMASLHSALTALGGRIEPIAADITAIGGNVAGLVEGTADGAALDSRVRESVSHEMRETETRLIAHVDEAVLALAETLLRRRPVSIASVPEVSAAEPEPAPAQTEEPLAVHPAAESAAVGAVGVLDDADDIGDDDEIDIDSDEVAAAGSADGEVDSDDADSDGGSDSGLDEFSDTQDFPAADLLSAAVAAEAAEAAAAGESATADPDAEPDAADEWDPAGVVTSEAPAAATEPPSGSAYVEPAQAWSPQTPPQRDADAPAEPEPEPSKKKRRWFGN